jgi:hypothetical protein
MAKTKVFVSFDFDNDQALKNLLLGQAKNSDSPFDVTDLSLKEEQPQAQWEQKALAAIKRSDVVVTVLGAKTHSASGVKKEIAMAIEEKKNRFQIQPQDESRTPVEGGGKKYDWTWDNLKKLLA